jgi:hypothetical protein
LVREGKKLEIMREMGELGRSSVGWPGFFCGHATGKKEVRRKGRGLRV